MMFRRTITMGMLLAVAGAAHAGWYYEAETLTTSPEQRGQERTRVLAWVEGPRARLEFSEDSDMDLGSDGSYLLTEDGGETMLLVDPKEQAYTEFNLGETANMAKAMMDQMGGMFQISFENPYAEKTGESAGDTLLGRDTRKVDFRTGYTMKMSIMGRDMGQKVDSEGSLWVADDIDAEAFDAWLRPDKRLKGVFEGLDEVMSGAFSQIDGVPLKTVMNTTSTDSKGKSSQSTMTTTVTVLREEAVADERFAIPEGYERRDLGLAQGEDGEKDAGSNPMEALKGLFGRDRD